MKVDLVWSLIHATTGQVVFASNVCILLVVDSLQLWTIGDPVAQATAVGAPDVISDLEVLLLFRLEGGQEGRHPLFGLHQQVLQVEQDSAVDALVDERRGSACVLSTTCATNSMHVVLDVIRHVVVDHVLDLWKIQTCNPK